MIAFIGLSVCVIGLIFVMIHAADKAEREREIALAKFERKRKAKAKSKKGK